jgi:hypothetical protein
MMRSRAGTLALLIFTLGQFTPNPGGLIAAAEAQAQSPWPEPGAPVQAAPPAGGPFGTAPASPFGAAPPPPQPPSRAQQVCSAFPKLSEEAQKRGTAVGEAIKTHVDRKQVCALMNSFLTAESTVLKFLVDNQTLCGVPVQALNGAKAGHEKSLKFRTQVCSEDIGHGKPPTLSDAIKAPAVDSANNTKTGRGTFDTLTGNPLSH